MVFMTHDLPHGSFQSFAVQGLFHTESEMLRLIEVADKDLNFGCIFFGKSKSGFLNPKVHFRILPQKCILCTEDYHTHIGNFPIFSFTLPFLFLFLSLLFGTLFFSRLC